MTTFEQEVVDAMPEFLKKIDGWEATAYYRGFHGGLAITYGREHWAFVKSISIKEAWARIAKSRMEKWQKSPEEFMPEVAL